MNTLRNILVTMTLAAIAVSGSAQAREKGNKDRGFRDGTRVEQRAERRAERRPVADRQSRRENRRRDYSDNHGRVDRRQDRQRARIKQGRRSGELSRGELRRLNKQQRKIGRMERRFNSDGHLLGKERRRLERAQDRASKRIARMKHNDVYRGSGRRYAQSHGYGYGRGYSRYGWWR